MKAVKYPVDYRYICKTSTSRGWERGQSCKWRNLTRRHLLCPSECLRSSPWFFIRSLPVPWCRLLAVSLTRVWIYEFFSWERELVSEWLPALGSSPTIPPYTHSILIVCQVLWCWQSHDAQGSRRHVLMFWEIVVKFEKWLVHAV